MYASFVIIKAFTCLQCMDCCKPAVQLVAGQCKVVICCGGLTTQPLLLVDWPALPTTQMAQLTKHEMKPAETLFE